MSQSFPRPFQYSGGNVKVELNLANYASKNDLKGTSGIQRDEKNKSKRAKKIQDCPSRFKLAK